jgi:hypothetical protein
MPQVWCYTSNHGIIVLQSTANVDQHRTRKHRYRTTTQQQKNFVRMIEIASGWGTINTND